MDTVTGAGRREDDRNIRQNALHAALQLGKASDVNVLLKNARAIEDYLKGGPATP